jgi:zinc protease
LKDTISIHLPEIHGRTLENGLKVLAVSDARLPLVNLVLMLKRGAEGDEEGKAGRADLAFEMLTLGTEKRSSQDIALDIDSLGARLAFHSGWDASFVEIEGLSEDLRPLFEILADMILHPTFPTREFDQLKGRRIAALIQDQDESDVVADVQFVQLAFEGTPYGHPRRGTVKSVGGISLEDLKRFYDRDIVANQCILLVVGNTVPEEIFQLTEETLGSLKNDRHGSSPAPFSIQRGPHPTIRIVHRADLTQSQIRIGHPGIERKNRDYERFQVANYILGGGGFSSRLMDRIRSQKGYTYGIHSSYRGRRSPGPFLISTFTPTETTVAVVREVLEVVNGLIREGSAKKELEEAKAFYLGSYPFRFETAARIAREFLDLELYGLGLDTLTEYPGRISGVTQSDIKSVLEAYLFPDAFSIVLVGNGEAFKKEMGEFGTVQIIDFQTLVAQR